ncbi:hypothetical protein CCMA1212_004414 [Trichoderma ghanense]|uniref:Uncharacterized protein n=1 Tax=Trichoderma ghanense TaxID=65468 RepID=A0ABY2H4J1_9HYPO
MSMRELSRRDDGRSGSERRHHRSRSTGQAVHSSGTLCLEPKPEVEPDAEPDPARVPSPARVKQGERSVTAKTRDSEGRDGAAPGWPSLEMLGSHEGSREMVKFLIKPDLALRRPSNLRIPARVCVHAATAAYRFSTPPAGTAAGI